MFSEFVNQLPTKLHLTNILVTFTKHFSIAVKSPRTSIFNIYVVDMSHPNFEDFCSVNITTGPRVKFKLPSKYYLVNITRFIHDRKFIYFFKTLFASRNMTYTNVIRWHLKYSQKRLLKAKIK